MEEVNKIIEAKYSDEEFLGAVKGLENSEVIELFKEVERIHRECVGELKIAIDEFRDTGIPSNSEWFHKCKGLANIRKQHLMMLRRELSIRSISKNEIQNTR
mgnify:CR=1 FL=1